MGCILCACSNDSDSESGDISHKTFLSKRFQSPRIRFNSTAVVSYLASTEFGRGGDSPLLTMWSFRNCLSSSTRGCSVANEDDIYVPNLDQCTAAATNDECRTSADECGERSDIIEACIDVMDACNSDGSSGDRQNGEIPGHSDRKTRSKGTQWWTVLRTSVQVATVWEQLLKNRRNNWVQLAGHQGSIAPASLSTVWKKMPGAMCNEVCVYEQLMKDEMSGHVPKFHRNVVFNNEYFLEMEDLLCHFKDPAVMDIKMGTRTFLETEVTSVKLREDLYEKMIKLDPNEPTEEENKAHAITKLRYMQIHGESTQPTRRCLKETEDIREMMSKFCGVMRDSILNELEVFRNTFISSQFFRHHEVIGSSLLLLYDADHSRARVWMIDFGKTFPLPDGRQTDHRQEWKVGNHEDGFMTGLDNLIEIVKLVHSEKEDASGNG